MFQSLSSENKKKLENIMPDRGGGRETKGASLKTSKKNPGSTAAKVKKEARAGPVRQVDHLA